MKVAAPFITVLITLVTDAVSHSNRDKVAWLARHAHVPRGAPATATSSSHINARARRACRPRPTATSSLPVGTLPSTPAIPLISQSTFPSAGDPSSANTGPINGLVNVVSAGSCGPSGATKQTTALSGPNGNIDFLNCGLTSAGWTPPLIYIAGIVSVQLSQVAYSPRSAFFACKDFVPLFEKYGLQYGVPAVMLASFAMQESSCNPAAVGGAGEQGLMQITVDKCGGAPNGNCQDPDFNVRQGALFFSQTLDSVSGDLLLAIGRYNGWYKGLTYAEATAAAQNGNCYEQNNLDYLHQLLNGWMQGINVYEHDPPLGKYFNLNSCAN